MRFSTKLLAVLFLVVPAAAHAQNNNGRSGDAQVGFTAAEQHIIEVYFSTHPMDVEPLPPGIVKRLQHGKALPPGIARRQMPAALTEELPPRDDGVTLEVTIFGDRIVLLEASGLVVDVLEGVFGG